MYKVTQWQTQNSLIMMTMICLYWIIYNLNTHGLQKGTFNCFIETLPAARFFIKDWTTANQSYINRCILLTGL